MRYERDSCRLCGQRELDLALSLTPTPLADAYVAEDRAGMPQPSYPLDLMLCRNCGHTQLSVVIPPEIIYRDYLYETTTSLGLPAHFRGYAGSVVARQAIPPGSLVVDIGSNDGTLLKAFASSGMRVLGVDPAKDVARRATEAGVETIAEFFDMSLADRIRAEHGPAAVITANNVFANVDDLDELMLAIRGLLASDGVFVVESSYVLSLVRNMIFDFIYHEHLSYFAVAPLRRFLDRHGLELIDVELVPTKGGSLRCTAQLAGGPRQALPTVGSFLADEERAGIAQTSTFARFGVRIADRRSDTWRAIDAIGSKVTVDGFGASPTTTTLMYHFGLTQAVRYLLDDNPIKQGLLSPGVHIPVVPADTGPGSTPDAIIVFAWRYAAPIIERHGRYLDVGSRLIVPLPTVTTVGGHEAGKSS